MAIESMPACPVSRGSVEDPTMSNGKFQLAPPPVTAIICAVTSNNPLPRDDGQLADANEIDGELEFNGASRHPRRTSPADQSNSLHERLSS